MSTSKNILEAFEATNHLGQLDVVYIIGASDTWEEFIENAQQAIYETEVIYYHVAMEYLAENDASLSESIAILSEQGVEIGEVNSELLATVHLQNAMIAELHDLDSFEDSLFEEAA